MPAQIVDEFRPLPPAQMVGAADQSQRERRWRWLDQRIDGLSGEIEALARLDQGLREE